MVLRWLVEWWCSGIWIEEKRRKLFSTFYLSCTETTKHSLAIRLHRSILSSAELRWKKKKTLRIIQLSQWQLFLKLAFFNLYALQLQKIQLDSPLYFLLFNIWEQLRSGVHNLTELQQRYWLRNFILSPKLLKPISNVCFWKQSVKRNTAILPLCKIYDNNTAKHYQ